MRKHVSGLIFSAALASLSMPAVSAVCGPGVDWLASCPAGTDNFSVTLTFGVDLDFDNFAEENAVFTGTAAIVRPLPTTNSTGISRIDWQLSSMQLTGQSGLLSGTTLTAGTDFGLFPPTTSRIVEDADPTSAFAYLDYRFTLDHPNLGVLTPESAKTLWMEATIDQLPPDGADFRHTGCCFGTFIDVNDVNGMTVFQIVDLLEIDGFRLNREDRPSLSLQAVPLPASLYLLGMGLAVLGYGKRKRPSHSIKSHGTSSDKGN